jgi:hypothetical protein
MLRKTEYEILKQEGLRRTNNGTSEQQQSKGTAYIILK